jgi:hypothetical protein
MEGFERLQIGKVYCAGRLSTPHDVSQPSRCRKLTHDDWNDGNDALVDGTGGPCGPTALGGTSNNEVGDVVAKLVHHVVSHGVHGTNDGL